jgi:hypothetical protein
LKVRVWCAMSAQKIIGNMFFKKNSKFWPLGSINSNTILKGIYRKRENVWLFHVGRCHGPHSNFIMTTKTYSGGEINSFWSTFPDVNPCNCLEGKHKDRSSL